jgi:outer membrane protein assembly factor BamB
VKRGACALALIALAATADAQDLELPAPGSAWSGWELATPELPRLVMLNDHGRQRFVPEEPPDPTRALPRFAEADLVRELVARRSTLRAMDELARALDGAEPRIVLDGDQVGDVRTRSAALLRGLPAEARAVWRSRRGPDAGRALADARASADPRALLALRLAHPGTTEAHAAQVLAAELLFERGSPLAAARVLDRAARESVVEGEPLAASAARAREAAATRPARGPRPRSLVPIWSRSIDPPGRLASGVPAVEPVVDGGSVLIEERASLARVDLATGRTVFTVRLPELDGRRSRSARPAVGRGFVAVARAGRLFVVDRDGRAVWVDIARAVTASPSASLLVDGLAAAGDLFVASLVLRDERAVAAFEPSGRLAWVARLWTAAPRAALAGDDDLVVVRDDTGVAGLDATTGAVLWLRGRTPRAPFDACEPAIALGAHRVLSVTPEGVSALDPVDGRSLATSSEAARLVAIDEDGAVAIRPRSEALEVAREREGRHVPVVRLAKSGAPAWAGAAASGWLALPCERWLVLLDLERPGLVLAAPWERPARVALGDGVVVGATEDELSAWRISADEPAPLEPPFPASSALKLALVVPDPTRRARAVLQAAEGLDGGEAAAALRELVRDERAPQEERLDALASLCARDERDRSVFLGVLQWSKQGRTSILGRAARGPRGRPTLAALVGVLEHGHDLNSAFTASFALVSEGGRRGLALVERCRQNTEVGEISALGASLAAVTVFSSDVCWGPEQLAWLHEEREREGADVLSLWANETPVRPPSARIHVETVQRLPR